MEGKAVCQARCPVQAERISAAAYGLAYRVLLDRDAGNRGGRRRPSVTEFAAEALGPADRGRRVFRG